MKTHTSDFKSQIKNMGRQLDNVITYGSTTLRDELFSVTPIVNANILKSVMKQLDIESSVDIPKETVINYQLSVLVNGDYEYLDFGNYVVYSSEKQEDEKTYKITCYDKMLYAMKQNENLSLIYPITIKNYLIEIANAIGLTVASGTFYNQDLQIPAEIYAGLEYTYRDILDEIAQATGSVICINANDEIEVRYPNATSDTINEEFLKDVNVNFAEKYGPINSIVLSRAGGSDNVYTQDTESVLENGLCEVKIVDNQIMNGNNRSDYLQGILSALDGLYYYKNDFSSTGICYYDVYDLYNIQIGENTYQCLMLNDEIDIKNGIEEYIHTDIPEQSQTDYSKADKTDRRINETYLIVDKQNQSIEAMASNITEQNEEIASIRLQYNELLSRISDIADITTSGESSYASVNLVGVNTSQPISIKIHPILENICFLYPYSGLYPSSTLYSKSRKLRFTNTETNEIFDWVLPTDLWYYDGTHYDELELAYGDGTNSSVTVTRKCKINADATISLLSTPTTETYAYPTGLVLTDGDYTISLVDNTTGYLYVQLMAKNIYTTQFYTKAETNTLIDQTASDITLGVSQTLSNYSTTNQMNTAINLKAGEITSSVSQTYETKANAQTNYSTINQTINGVEIEVGQKYNTSDFTNAKITAKINDGTSNVKIDADKIDLAGKTIRLTSDDINIQSNNFSVDKYGNMTCSNAEVTGGNIALTSDSSTTPKIKVTKSDSSLETQISTGGFRLTESGLVRFWANPTLTEIRASDGTRTIIAGSFVQQTNILDETTISSNGQTGNITCVSLTQTSLESIKKNIKQSNINALDIVKNARIYQYNLKSEEDKDKKHIGFIIGDKYETPKEVLSQDGQGIDMYTMSSIMWKAIQEQQRIIEDLQAKIKEMESDKND